MFVKNNIITLSLLLIILSACGAKIRNGGYSLRSYQINDLSEAKNKNQVLQIAGSPSVKIEHFNKNNEIWLYASYKSEQTGFLNPEYKNYDIVILSFDNDGNIKQKQIKKLDQDKFIKYSDAKTEFPGEIRLELISELFGHIGKVSTLPGSTASR